MLRWLRGGARKTARFNVSDQESLAAWLGYSGAGQRSQTVEGAIGVTAVLCAARVIAEGLAQMPVRVVEERYAPGAAMPQLIVRRDHWAHRLLAERPNGWQTSYEFREGLVFCAVLAGGAVAIKNFVPGLGVTELLPVPPGAWTVEQASDWSVQLRVSFANGTSGVFDQSQVLYLRGPSLDGVRALPAVRLARQAIGLSQALEEQQAMLAQNGGKPSGILSWPKEISEGTRRALRDTWAQRFGPGGQGGIAILDNDAKFTSMTMTSVDAQFLETRRLQIEEIARAFRVQPIMLMQADKAATFASAEQMFRNHVIHTLGPWIARFEDVATRDILGFEDGLRVDLDERNLLRGDFKDQAEYYAKALGAGGTPAWMTQDEVRAEVGLNPLGGRAAELSPGAMNAAAQGQETGGGADNAAV